MTDILKTTDEIAKSIEDAVDVIDDIDEITGIAVSISGLRTLLDERTKYKEAIADAERFRHLFLNDEDQALMMESDDPQEFTDLFVRLSESLAALNSTGGGE